MRITSSGVIAVAGLAMVFFSSLKSIDIENRAAFQSAGSSIFLTFGLISACTDLNNLSK